MEVVTPSKHAHDIELHDTFDFVNTHELVDGVPKDHFKSLSEALDWFQSEPWRERS